MVHEFVDTSHGDSYWVQKKTTTAGAAGSTVTLNDTAPTADRWNFAAVEITPPTISFTRDPSGGLVSERIGTASYYYMFDAQSSVLGLVNSSGTAVASYSYDPYGQARAATASVMNPFRYISGVLDAATGLTKLGARYYDAILGRFTQPDPSGQESNPYLYSGGDPVNGGDPTGLDKCQILLVSCADAALFALGLAAGPVYGVLIGVIGLYGPNALDLVRGFYENLGIGFCSTASSELGYPVC